MYNPAIRNSVLFKDLTDDELETALKTLKAEERIYTKDETILSAGNVTTKIGLVLKGSVTIENNDIWGNKTILSHIGKGQFFAETYAILMTEPLMVDVIANENCSILFLNLNTINTISESWAVKILKSLLIISANKNIILSNRSFHTAPKTIRGRVMAYLNSISLQNHSREFDIPFDRQQLADYLNTDRSALSKELGKMQKDRIIEVSKNHFIIKADIE